MLSKSEIIAKYQYCPGDTGSTRVQIALMCEKIEKLKRHMQAHKKDNCSLQGLLKCVAKLRKLSKYCKDHNLQDCLTLVKQYGLRG